MFGRKKRDRIISDWATLQDALVGNFDAEETGTGAMRLHVKWKAENREQEIVVAYAPVQDLGQIAYITAPILENATRHQLQETMEESAKFLDGGVVIDGGFMALRATLPIEETPFSIVARTIRQIAANADEIGMNLDQ